jgi:YfiH family protein
VANLNPIKDQGTLLRAFAQVAARAGDVRLDCVGEDTMGGRIQRLARELGVAADRLVWMDQVHGTRVAVVDGPVEGPLEGTDAVVTRTPGLVLCVLVADCVPVLLADPDAPAVAALHAGWRGLAAGVVEAGVAAVAELGADPAATVGLVGPAVGGCCYEVGADVRAAVGDRYPAALATTRDGRPSLDPAVGAAEALARAGVGEVRVAGECTFDLAERFFSHRRDHGRTGRQAGLVALVPGGADSPGKPRGVPR